MLEVRNISFGYGEGSPLFSDASFILQSKERVCITGDSGSGKTTFCKLLAGYEAPQHGSILIDGKPLPEKGVMPVQMIGQHPEHALDPRMRMRDSLLEAGPIDERLIGKLGIRDEWMTRYPHELSGGEMQRFCVARALASHPRYLVADEISTMLDAVTQAQIWHFLIDEAEQSGLGIVFVSHSPALADRVATRKVDISELRAL